MIIDSMLGLYYLLILRVPLINLSSPLVVEWPRPVGVLSSTCQRLNNTPVSRVLGEVLKVQRRRSLARKHTWNPTVWVVEIPNGGSDASLHGDAGSDGVLVVNALLCQVGGVGGERKADIKLGLRNLDAGSHEVLEVLDLRLARGGGADDQMGLRADTINLDLLLLEAADEFLDGSGLVAASLEVVVVDVKLRRRVNLGGSLEGEREVVLADDVVEDGLAEGTVVVEGLVYDIPGVALALPLGEDLGNVVDHHGGESLLGPVAELNPFGKLAVPD